MAILELIPREYWRQLKAERSGVDFSTLTITETPAQRSKRIAAEYDAAIRRKQREYSRQMSEKRRDRLKPDRKRRE
ncbi:MAG: hypothetical protein K2H33_04565 [Muribaculaceae bacterium]|nr:hypothetical protein [Muribaculaceae bacterium]